MFEGKKVGETKEANQRSALLESVLRATSYFCLPLLWDTQTCIRTHKNTFTHSRNVAVTRGVKAARV